jgi:hypothetical protein
MEIYDTDTEIASRKNWLLSLIVIVLVTFGVLILMQGFALALVPTLFKISIDELLSLMTDLGLVSDFGWRRGLSSDL